MDQIYKRNWKNYLKVGLVPLPAPPGMKGPVISWADFQQEPPCSDEYFEWEERFGDYNVWILLGKEFIVLDPDNPEAEEFVQSLALPTCPTSVSGGKSVHRWFRASRSCEPVLIRKNKKIWLELRTGQLGMLAPPSIHPDTGRPYVWREGFSPWEISFPEFPADAYQQIKSLSGNGSNFTPKSANWIKEFFKGIPDGGRNIGLTQLAGRYIAKGLSREEILPILEAVNSRSVPPKPEREVQTILDSVFKTHHRKHSRNMEKSSVKVGPNLTDLGNAKRFVAAHGKDVRYCFPWGKWIFWDGTRWRIDDIGEVFRRAKDTVVSLYEEAAHEVDEGRRKAVGNHALRCESDGRIKALVELAKSEPGIPILPDQLDRDPFVLNVFNGIVDLLKGELLPHCREVYLSKLAPVEFNPVADCPYWIEHLHKIMTGNENLIRFLQKAYGYSLSGNTDERAAFIMYGVGANGKTTSNEVISQILGDYAVRTPTESLLVKREGGIPNDIAKLKGARFVYCSEAEEGKRLSESLLKDITGGDTIAARFMRGEWFEFQPTFKIWLSTNHKPIIRGTDNAVWDRIRLIPFTFSIPEEERIPRRVVMNKFQEELPGILAWMVKGCLEWQRTGLGAPHEVKEATGKYREEMDLLGQFITDSCFVSKDAEESAKNLYGNFLIWAEKNGEKPVSQRTFGTRLAERGFQQGRTSTGAKKWIGIGLNSPEI